MRTKVLLVFGLVLVVCLLAVAGTASGSPDIYFVNTTGDGDDGSCDELPGGNCTLREALNEANVDGVASTIAFKIPPGDTGHEVSGITGTWTISLTAPLPSLSEGGTIISGTTQAAFIGGDPNVDGPEIELSGASATGDYLLHINSADNVIHGLVINASPGSGILIRLPAASGNTVSGNYIGTDAAGASKRGNASRGIRIMEGADYNLIGGQTPGQRNVISGNGSMGVDIYGGGNDNNTICGNYIGTDATGTQPLGNTHHGVRIHYAGQNNTIGGDTVAERNVISANGWSGVDIGQGGANGNTVSGNYIGTDVSGTQDLGNTISGVGIRYGAQNNTIGQGNVISGNDDYGVDVQSSGTMSNTISGNYIGTDATGTASLGNGSDGLHIYQGAANNTIGPNNTIAYNVQDGVLVSDSGSTGNTITQNSIHSNGDLGIGLVTGGNGNMAHPDLDEPAACMSVTGQAMPNATIEVFSDADGQGRFWEDGSVEWDGQVFTFTPASGHLRGPMVTATATDPATGNTSPFSVSVHSGCLEVFLPLVVKGY